MCVCVDKEESRQARAGSQSLYSFFFWYTVERLDLRAEKAQTSQLAFTRQK